MTIFWRPKGCILWYDFSELSGTKVYDLSGNGNHGTIYGAIWRRGPLIGALYFDGVDDKVLTPIDADGMPTLSYEILFSLESKPSSLPYRPIGDPGVFYFNIPVSPSTNLQAVFVDASGTAIVLNTQVYNIDILGRYVHVYAFFDVNKAGVYINGVLRDYKTFSDTTLRAPGTGYKISVGTDQVWYANVSVALVRLYNRVLSEAEIKAHYRYLIGRVQRIRRRLV